MQIPKDIVGKTFNDAVVDFLQRDGSILVGVITEKKTFDMEEMLSSESNAIDEFIRRKFSEAGRNLEVESKGRVSVHINPGKDYRITEYDYAVILTPKNEESVL